MTCIPGETSLESSRRVVSNTLHANAVGASSPFDLLC